MAKRAVARAESVYGLMLGIKRKGKRRATQIYPKEFTRYEIAAIGVMTIQWAYLEHMLLVATIDLVDAGDLPMPDDATSVAFERRIGAFRDVVRKRVTEPKRRRSLLALATKISNIHNDRNMVTHGLWEWFPSKPTKLRLYTFRPPFKFDTNFDLGRLATLCDRIGEINHELAHPPKAGLQRLKHRGSYISRELAIIFSGADPLKFGISVPGFPPVELPAEPRSHGGSISNS